ncbi:MAG: hypothetical protein CSA09_03870 [Candidatus Contendobacter odensis]|uniref:DUF7918 domain-containing protein n=1 Tax=Candidatus Contendibacter odensensis TaxID=1400860 RepID=A0A2G6PEQ0_9GAMM|nr:MAG: hypothetical protein CSA09_03870 [Candidatus Contendobacter odensis]
MRINWQIGWIAVLIILAGPATVWAQRFDTGNLEVEIIDDRGREFRQYPLRRGNGRRIYKAYVEAKDGRRYSIRVRNHSNQRVGVVIAVDGRNIITGKRSYLRSSERMYVLRPYQQERYEGWRTGKNRVNRFYFTDAGDSYAEAWGDRSAMGVIAVAVFREDVPARIDYRKPYRSDKSRVQSAPGAAASAPRRRAEPGTGFGESEWSPSRRVEFEPEDRPVARYFLKYVWRNKLCRKGIIRCDKGWRGYRRNRFWDEDDDYAPPPYENRRRYYDRWYRDEWR